MKPHPNPFVTAATPGPVVRTSPAAVRSLRASREAAQRVADRHPPACFEPTPLCAAILLALPSSRGVPMDATAVALALKSGDPAHALSIEAVADELVALADVGLLIATAQPGDTPLTLRWRRSATADALPVVRARYRADDGEVG